MANRSEVVENRLLHRLLISRSFLTLLVVFVFLWTLHEVREMNISSQKWRKVVTWLEMKDFLDVSSATLKNEYLNNSRVTMDDPVLLSIIRKRFIAPSSTLPRNFKNVQLNWEDEAKFVIKEGNSSPTKGAFEIVYYILKTFIDDPFYAAYGAGESNWGPSTIWLEKIGWTGLIVDADNESLEKFQKKHPNTYLGKFCLSNTTHPQIATFYKDERKSGLWSSLFQNNRTNELASKLVSVQCFPLVSVLLAMQRPVVDFFSVNIAEGGLDILKTVDFSLITFKVLSVKNLFSHAGDREIRNFVEEKGYIHYMDVNLDCIFIHPTVKL